ncbi:MAG: glycosyltransferase [Candidatus Dormibacteria bacterium]
MSGRLNAGGTVGYLTKRFPRLSETFILGEILGLEAAGVPLRLYALAHPGEDLVQPDVALVASQVVYLHGGAGRRHRAADATAVLAAHSRLFWRSPRRYLGVVAYIARKRRHLSTLRHFLEAGRLALLLEAEDSRHLHAAFAHGPASVAHFVHLLTGLPFSFAAHAKDLYLSAPDLLARKIAAAEFVLACSESAAAALRSLAGSDPGKIRLAHHGVDTGRFAPEPAVPAAGEGALRILAVGRLVEKKGYPVLLQALAALVAGGSAISCQIIGSGPQRAGVEADIERWGLDGAVTLLGSRTHNEVAAAYRSADVFVQASVILADGDRDGIPNSLLEAMASGLAVVASDVAGIPEVVRPGCGLLVPPGDADALASALAGLALDRDRVRQLGAGARAYVVDNLDRMTCAGRVAPLFAARPSEALAALAS